MEMQSADYGECEQKAWRCVFHRNQVVRSLPTLQAFVCSSLQPACGHADMLVHIRLEVPEWFTSRCVIHTQYTLHSLRLVLFIPLFYSAVSFL